MVYDDDTHICCMDKLHVKPLDVVEVECCLDGLFNPLTQHCCIEGLFGSGPLRAELARMEPGVPRGRGCFRALKRPPTTD